MVGRLLLGITQPIGTIPTATHPYAMKDHPPIRLACVKQIESLNSELRSNSIQITNYRREEDHGVPIGSSNR